MKKRIIIIAVICIAAVTGLIIWALSVNSQSAETQSKAPTDEEKILTLANEDVVASEYNLTANNVVIEKKEGDWVYARITYRSSVSGSTSTYPVILLKDSGGDFSIVSGFDGSTTPAELTAKHVPESIINAIQTALPVPSEMEDSYE